MKNLGLLVSTALLLAGAPLKAQTDTRLSAQDRQDIVASLSQALRQRYIFPDIGERAASAIDTALASGAYDALPDPAHFAARLATDVNAIAHDKHLDVWPSAAPPPHPARAPVPFNEAGIVRADRLAGGIGYLQITAFADKRLFQEAIDKAMTSLEGSRALIIDDRDNHGGAPASVAYLASFLLAQGRPINTVVSRTPGTHDFTRETWRAVPTPVRFIKVPVYVLTSHATISAGEELAYDLQAQHRATVIGEVTAGGANPAIGVDLVHGAVAIIPFGRAENPVTHDNWEGRGVRPDMAVPGEDALTTALAQLGHKPAMTIEDASVKQLFSPRTTPRPASAQSLRHMIASYASGHPDYAAMTPDCAEQIREEVPHLQSLLAPLGEVESLSFLKVDRYGDNFLVTFAHGTRAMGIALLPDGKVLGTTDPVTVPPGT